ncbi:DNA topoisomerase 1 [Hordeum vulgare]|nr:DNA topoisomerase 1 [Hordeum vulgare]
MGGLEWTQTQQGKGRQRGVFPKIKDSDHGKTDIITISISQGERERDTLRRAALTLPPVHAGIFPGDPSASPEETEKNCLHSRGDAPKVCPFNLASSCHLEEEAMPATPTFDSDEFNGPASFKRPSASLKQNSMPTPSSSGNAQHCQKSTLKRPHVEDVLMVDTDDSDDDDKPLALRKKADDREFKRINAYNVDSDSEDEKPLSARLFKDAASPSGGNVSDDDDSDDDKTLAARFSLVTRNSVDMPIEPNNTALKSSASSAPRNSIKRPCDSNIQPSSALKKAKCTDSSASASSEDDGSDNVPLARRLTVGESSKRKPPAKDIAKKKKNKISSSSKITRK